MWISLSCSWKKTLRPPSVQMASFVCCQFQVACQKKKVFSDHWFVPWFSWVLTQLVLTGLGICMVKTFPVWAHFIPQALSVSSLFVVASTSSLMMRMQFIYLLHSWEPIYSIIKTSRFQILNVFIPGTVSNSNGGSQPSSVVFCHYKSVTDTLLGLVSIPETVSVSNSAACHWFANICQVRNYAIKPNQTSKRKLAVFTKGGLTLSPAE